MSQRTDTARTILEALRASLSRMPRMKVEVGLLDKAIDLLGQSPGAKRTARWKANKSVTGDAQVTSIVTHERREGDDVETQESRQPNVSVSPLASPLSVSLSESYQLLTPSQQDQSAREREDVTRVYTHWLTAMGKDPKRHKLTPDRRTKIIARLRSHSADDLCAAIDGCKRSDFHMGASGQTYNDLTTILKSAAAVDQHIDRVRGGGGVTVPRKGPAPIDDWNQP